MQWIADYDCFLISIFIHNYFGILQIFLCYGGCLLPYGIPHKVENEYENDECDDFSFFYGFFNPAVIENKSNSK